MWTILKIDRKYIHQLKSEFLEKLGNEVKFYIPKLKIKKFKKQKVLFKESLMLGDYLLCYHKNFSNKSIFASLQYCRGLKYFLSNFINSQKEIENFIIKNKITNCHLLGFKHNPFKYLKKSKLYISTSLWEDPGHTLIEAGYLNVPILSSGCPNGPKEIIIDNFNGLKYELNNTEDLANKMFQFQSFDENQIFNIKKNFKKKIVLNYTKFRFAKKFHKVFH